MKSVIKKSTRWKMENTARIEHMQAVEHELEDDTLSSKENSSTENEAMGEFKCAQTLKQYHPPKAPSGSLGVA